MRVALVRGQHLNKWEAQNFVSPDLPADIVGIATHKSLHSLIGIGLPVKRLISLDPLAASLPGSLFIKPVLLGLGISNRLFRLEQHLRGFDIVHVADTHYTFSWQAARAKRALGFKLVATCWETIPFEQEHLPFVSERKQLVRSQVDRFIAMSERAAAALRTEGVAAEKISVILPGIDLAAFRPLPRPSAAPAPVWSDSHAIRILYVGRLDFAKGVRELLLAAAQLLHGEQGAMPLEFAIVGNGPRQIVDPLLDSLGLRQRVRVVAGLNYAQMPSLYASADIFVLPSVPTPHWEEQFGMVLAESMACGKAVIATNSGAIPEVIGDAGVLVPPYDASALAAAIGRLAQDQAQRERLGRLAAARAARLFDARLFAKRMGELYQDLLCR